MDRVDRILRVLDEMFPTAQCELNHTNGFELLVAVMLSAQTTDKSVNLLTDSLFQKYKTPQDYLDVDITELQNDLRSIGLYKNKANNLQKMCKMLIEEFDGQVPHRQEHLETLPGVGRKTANVVLSVWFGVPRIAVDTHVERISKRLKLAYEKDNVVKVEEKLMRKIPRDRWSKTHHQMIFFGRYHCSARKPNCQDCKLIDLCKYKGRYDWQTENE